MRADFERLTLIKREKKLLARIRRHPGLRIDPKEVCRLREYRLIEAEPSGRAPSGQILYSDRWHISDTGQRYLIYRTEQRRDTFVKSFWCPFLVSVLTNLAINGMPQLLQWLQETASHIHP